PTGEGNGALDVNGSFAVTGGTLVAAGSSGMLVTPDVTGQGSLVVGFSAAAPAGTVVQVIAPDGSVVASFQTAKATEALVLTSPGIVSGTAYEIAVGGVVSGQAVGGYTAGGDAGAATTLGSLDAV
ncbi:MAG TPA: hypothetical protein VGK35_08835, partial [Actinotalea sp.]